MTPVSPALSKRHLVLIGMMGSGKSSVGRKLALQSGAPLVDTDELIERHCRRSIVDLFKELGEARFRLLERDLLCQAAEDETPTILSTGGGAVVTPENREALWRTGYVVYLQASPEVLWRRLKKNSTRPLLQQPDPRGVLTRLVQEREPLYLDADMVINVDQLTIAQAAQAIWTALPGTLRGGLNKKTPTP